MASCTQKIIEWRKANPEKAKKQVQRARARRRAAKQEYVLIYLKSHPCVDCGINDKRKGKRAFRIGQVVRVEFLGYDHFIKLIGKLDDDYFQMDWGGIKGPVHKINLNHLTGRERLAPRKGESR
jgi:hypothetical protein